MTKHLWEYDHPYYATPGCFFVAPRDYDRVHADWDSWQDFYDAWGDNDPDLNYLYRWDWDKTDPNDYAYVIEADPDFELPGDTLKLFFMLQRKAKPFSHEIVVTDEDEPAIRAYLTERAETLRATWAPIISPEDHLAEIRPGDLVEHVDHPALDARTVIGVGEDWVFLDFQQSQLNAGELPAPLPKSNYRKIELL